MPQEQVDAGAGSRQRVEFRGSAVAEIIVRLPRGVRATTSLVARLVDGRGNAVDTSTIGKEWFAILDRQEPEGWTRRLSITEPGTYRVQCEIDGVLLPEAEVEVRLRQTTEVDLKPAR
jgi:hypothetical protein